MFESDLCTYCGIVCDTIDHVVPQHLLKSAESSELDLSGVMRMQRWEVPSCRECNSAIGGKIFKTLAERRKYAKDHIRKKYASYLRTPNWTEEELDELGPNMKREVIRATQVKGRLAWTNGVKTMEIEQAYDLFRELWLKNETNK